MHLYSIDTGFFKLDGGAMFGVVPKSIWNRLEPADENNLCTWAMRCLLIEDDNRLILVDTGIGDKQDAKFFSHYYLHGDATMDSSLARYGFSRNDITDVFLTHLHFDHVGGSVAKNDNKLLPAFPNAVYWTNGKHWEHAMKPNAREKASFLRENILPLQESGQLNFTDSNVDPLKFSENISIRVVHGHTESMMLPQIQYRGRTILYMADLLPSVNHLPIPYVMAYDIQPLKTLDEKQHYLAEAVANDYILFFEHDRKSECCTLQETEKGIRAKDIFRLEELSGL
jgi:glyoxylase-like metal-dependent hydrolase (beta-lactamase superfamily II)